MKLEGDFSTRDRIIEVSIDLFARKGYKDVSVREIAEAVGIKASSLYKHYESKEDILNNIFDMFRKKMELTVLTDEELRNNIQLISPEVFLKESFEKFKLIMWNQEVVKIAKIITIEQQRNQSVRQFFMQELIQKPNQITQYAFELMVEKGLIDPIDTRILAEEYNSYIVYLYFEQNFLNESINFDEIDRKMKQHNEFYIRYILIRKGE